MHAIKIMNIKQNISRGNGEDERQRGGERNKEIVENRGVMGSTREIQ